MPVGAAAKVVLGTACELLPVDSLKAVTDRASSLAPHLGVPRILAHKGMCDLMQQDLEVIGRPFGEFIPGRNAAKPGQINKQIEIVKQLEIKGKTVTVPRALKGKPETTAEAELDDKAKKKAKRESRRKAREEAKSNSQKSSDK